MHQLGLVVSGGKWEVLLLGLWWIRIKGEGPSSDGPVGWIFLNREGS